MFYLRGRLSWLLLREKFEFLFRWIAESTYDEVDLSKEDSDVITA